MKNKVLIELIVPCLDEVYDIYVPINKRVGSVIEFINKSLVDITNGIYTISSNRFLYNQKGEKYDTNMLIRNTDIRNGSRVVLL